MNLKKLDDKDVVFLDEPWTNEELAQFREMLKKNKSRKFGSESNMPRVAKSVIKKSKVLAV